MYSFGFIDVLITMGKVVVENEIQFPHAPVKVQVKAIMVMWYCYI